MASFQIQGGTPLYGSVRLGGAKNASYKLMIAALLADSESRLLNFSHISEVTYAADIITKLGGGVEWCGERTLFINPANITQSEIPQEFGKVSRSAPMYIPALLHKTGKAIVPQPGGDKIGKRPLGWHFQALEEMGVRITQKETVIEAQANELQAIHFKFPKNSHTGTETLIMAAVLANGTTIIENAALEPEVDDLIDFLNSCGARIRRRQYRIIEIEGVDSLHGAIHKIMPDRNEAVSYACAALATKGDIIVENARRTHLEAFLEKLEEIGAGFDIGSYGIRFYHKGELRSTDIITQPHPGFMTDWQPLWAVLMSQAKGDSIIHEAVFPSRFQYVQHLKEMGVRAETVDIKVDDPEKIYNFTPDELGSSPHALKISGPNALTPGEFKVRDLRHGATLTIAALVAPGRSIIHNVEEIDRGYEDLDRRLTSMGAQIKRIG